MNAARALIGCAVFASIAAIAVPAAAQQVTVTVVVPAGVAFTVRDVSSSTQGAPATTQVSFSNPNGFKSTQKLRVSVAADSSTFSGPGTTLIAASKVSWVASTSSGTASNGTMASGTYTQVYLSPANLKKTDTGSVNLTWTLASIAASGLRSGTHTLTIRWRFEAF